MTSIKKYFIIAFLLLLASCSAPFKSWNKQVRKSSKEHLSQKPDLPTPPNTIWLRDNLFMDKSEITNLNYLEYLHYLSEDSATAVYQNQIPENGVWTDQEVPFPDSTKIKLALGYLEYEGFRFLPVVGVSYEQAVKYCEWRSKIATQNFVSTRSSKYEFVYRLPTEIEWEEAARAELKNSDYGYDTRAVAIKKFNLKDTADAEFPPTQYVYEEPVNSWGFHQMIGNVSEMIADKGISKGGSWMHLPIQSQIKRRIRYQYPASWLGFRCICEVKEK